MAATNPGKDNLIAWWSLDETSGTRADSHGSNDLTDNNTVTYDTGKQGNAADFEDSVGEYLSIADNADLSFGDEDFTIGCWIKIESLDGTFQYIMSKYDPPDDKREYVLLLRGTTDKLEFNVSGNGTAVTGAEWGSAISTGTWYFVVAWHDSVNNQVGIEVNNSSPVTEAHTAGCFDSDSSFMIGASSKGTPDQFLDGLADEAFVFDKVLSADEREWLYNSGSGRAYADLQSIPTSWDETDAGTGSIEQEDTEIVGGTYSVKMTNGVGAGNVVKLAQTLTVYDGRSYEFSGYCKGDWQLDIESGGNSDTDSGTNADWEAESVECVADGTSLTVTIQPDGDSDVAYFDSFTLEESAPVDYEYVNFLGTLIDIDPSSGQFDNPVTRCTAHDWIGYLSKQEIGLQALQSDKRADEALTTLLAEFPNAPEDTDFDKGVETFEVIFSGDSSDSSMARMFAKLARNEPGRIYSKGDGTLVFEKQGTRDGSGTPAFTIDGTMNEFDVTYTANNIYNIVSLDLKTQTIDAAATHQLFNVGQGIPIASGQSITLECNFTDEDTGQAVAGVDVVTPVASPHFGSTRTPASEDLNANLDDTNYQVGGTSLTVDLENTGGTDGYLNEFIILGKRLTDYDKITITKRNTTSINQVGNSKYTNRLDLTEDPTRAEAIADDILVDYAPSHTAGTRLEVLANITDALAAQLIVAEPSTLFTAVESVTGISKNFYIDNIRYRQDHTLLWVTIEADEA